MTAGLPALKQVRLPAIQDAGQLAALDDLGKRAVVQVTTHGLPAHTHVLRDLAHAHALRVEAHDIVVAGQPPRPTLLAQQLVFRRLDYGQLCNRCRVEHRRRRCGLSAPYHRHGARSAKPYACGSADVPTPRANWPANASGPPPAQRLAATPRTFGVAAATITTDDLNTRMSLQPGGQRVGRAVSKQVYDTALLQIDQNRAVGLAFLPGPVIDAQHLRRGSRRERTVAGQPQQGVSTDRHGLPRGAAGAGFTAQRQPDLALGIGKACGPAGKAAHDPG